jgi:hypothetical protein
LYIVFPKYFQANALTWVTATIGPFNVLSVTQEKSFDLGSADPRGSPTAVNLWLETDVFQLRKHYAESKLVFDKIHMFPRSVRAHCQGQSFSPE